MWNNRHYYFNLFVNIHSERLSVNSITGQDRESEHHLTIWYHNLSKVPYTLPDPLLEPPVAGLVWRIPLG